MLRRWDDGWARVSEKVPSHAPRPRVFAQAWHDPPRVFGDWMPDLLRLAGGEPFLTPPGSQSLDVSWEEVMEFDPQVVLISLPGIGLDYDPRDWLETEGWDRVEAAVSGRVACLDPALFSRPSLALLDAAGIVQGLIGEAAWGWPAGDDPRVRRLRPKP